VFDVNLIADESLVLEYLKLWPGEFVSKIEIARRAAGKSRFAGDPNWADGACRSLVESGLVESNSFAQFSLRTQVAASTVKCGSKTMFIAPHLLEILGKSGRSFDQPM
jgi:hypothetical protein